MRTLVLFVTVLVAIAAPAAAQIQSRPTDPPLVTAINESWYQLREPLQFAGELVHGYKRSSLTINANVAHATPGETDGFALELLRELPSKLAVLGLPSWHPAPPSLNLDRVLEVSTKPGDVHCVLCGSICSSLDPLN